MPIRVFTKWSKVLSVTYVVFADLRFDGPKTEARAFTDKLADPLIAAWRESNKQSEITSPSAPRSHHRQKLQSKVPAEVV